MMNSRLDANFVASVDDVVDVVVDVVAVKGEGIIYKYGITCLLVIYFKTIRSLYLLSSHVPDA